MEPAKALLLTLGALTLITIFSKMLKVSKILIFGPQIFLKKIVNENLESSRNT